VTAEKKQTRDDDHEHHREAGKEGHSHKTPPSPFCASGREMRDGADLALEGRRSRVPEGLDGSVIAEIVPVDAGRVGAYDGLMGSGSFTLNRESHAIVERACPPFWLGRGLRIAEARIGVKVSGVRGRPRRGPTILVAVGSEVIE
jgi:hypothetical protein